MRTHPQDARVSRLKDILAAARAGRPPDAQPALCLEECSAQALLPAARSADAGRLRHARDLFAQRCSFPLTQLCRDVCHYCTFAHAPRDLQAAYLSIEQVLEIARAGQAAGCKEALFTLGDKPELRYRAARTQLDAIGLASTLEYLERMRRARCWNETGLLPHLNPGVMSRADLQRLRPVARIDGSDARVDAPSACASAAGRTSARPTSIRSGALRRCALAGELRIPMTTGLLIGIGETRRERIEALLALRALHERTGTCRS